MQVSRGGLENTEFHMVQRTVREANPILLNNEVHFLETECAFGNCTTYTAVGHSVTTLLPFPLTSGGTAEKGLGKTDFSAAGTRGVY